MADAYTWAPRPDITNDALWTPSVWNKEIRRLAEPLYAFRQFARDVRSDWPGDAPTLSVLKGASDLTTAGTVLTAGTHIPRTNFTDGTVAYSPQEWGNALSPEVRQLKMTPFALQQSIADLLARDAAKVLDTEVRDTLLASVAAGTNSFSVGAGGTTVGATKCSYSGTTSTNYPGYRLTAYGVWSAVDYLANLNAPKVRRTGVGEGYIGILHPHQARGIKRDSEFRSAIEYAASNRLFNNEIGFWEGVYWIETTQGFRTTAVTAGTNYYCALIFGAQCFGEYVVTELKKRRDPDTDFGREQHHAWYFDGGWAVEFQQYLAGVYSLTGSPL